MASWLPTFVVFLLCAGSALVWNRRLRRIPDASRSQDSDLPTPEAATSVPGTTPDAAAIEAATTPAVPPGAMVFAGMWILYHFLLDISSLLEPAPTPTFDADRTLRAIQQSCGLLAAGVGVGWMLLTRGEQSQFRAFGAKADELATQLRNGFLTVTAAWLPVFAVILVSLPLRTAERQHSVFQLLEVRSSLEVYVWAILSAVVVAPLFEELLFRVILQTSLERAIGRAAIPVSAIVFAAVHGFPDSLAIVPLALVLGDAYQRRRSYWEIATTHALLNAVMLALDAVMPHG